MSMLKAALYYADCGWRIYPCVPGDKRAAIKKWSTEATSDPSRVEEWWRRRPDCNIAVVCGRASGIYVIEVDQHGEDGEASLRKAEKRLGPLPPTLEQRSGGGGRHLFFWYPHDRRLRTTASVLGKGIDTRSDNNSCILAPSQHPSGRRYEWVTPVRTTLCADLPDAWIKRLLFVDPPKIHAPLPPLRTMSDIGDRLIERKVSDLAHCGRGQRNAQLYKAAFYLATRSVARVVDWERARKSLLWAAKEVGLDQIETEQTINSAASGAGLR